jgi:uncharacterized membrane-anchored protein YhcB (DUF1043 family)
MQRRHFKHTATLKDRLAQAAQEARQHAKTLAPGKDRDDLLRFARQSDTASHIDEWLSSPGLRAPT